MRASLLPHEQIYGPAAYDEPVDRQNGCEARGCGYLDRALHRCVRMAPPDGGCDMPGGCQGTASSQAAKSPVTAHSILSHGVDGASGSAEKTESTSSNRRRRLRRWSSEAKIADLLPKEDPCASCPTGPISTSPIARPASSSVRPDPPIPLNHAQLSLARQYGFPSWPKLKAEV